MMNDNSGVTTMMMTPSQQQQFHSQPAMNHGCSSDSIMMTMMTWPSEVFSTSIEN